MKRAARARPASSVCASVKISSNWSKISSGMSVLPASSCRTSSRWCRNSQSDSPAAGDAGLRPLTGVARGLQDGLLDLLAGLRRIGGVVDANIDRTVAVPAQARHEARAQDRGLAEAGLAEQHREELALHAARELGDFLLAAVEDSSRVSSVNECEAEPGIALVHCGRGTARLSAAAFMTAAPA